jgi:hypothetical protein
LGCFVSDSVYIHMIAHVRKHMAVRQPFAIDVDKHHKQDWLMEGSFQFSFGASHPAWCGGWPKVSYRETRTMLVCRQVCSLGSTHERLGKTRKDLERLGVFVQFERCLFLYSVIWWFPKIGVSPNVLFPPHQLLLPDLPGQQSERPSGPSYAIGCVAVLCAEPCLLDWQLWRFPSSHGPIFFWGYPQLSKNHPATLVGPININKPSGVQQIVMNYHN